MDYIRVSSVGGLFHEFYNPITNGLSIFELNYNENILDATNVFWTLIFDINNIKQIIHKISPHCPKYIAVMANTEIFIKQVERAKTNICSSQITPADFFCYLETLSTVCHIYSEYIFYPHRLTLQNGFETNNFSASQIYKNCLDNKENPYLQFVKLYVMPQIKKELPQVIFIDGAPTFYNMSICRLVKKLYPKIHICISRHSSEYFSLNKIESYLVQNEYLFKMVDSIILEYFDQTEKQLLSALRNNIPLSEVSNLIYRSCNKIFAMPYKSEKQEYTPVLDENHSTSKLTNVHLQPYNICYWNKCTFCGINKKYHFSTKELPEDVLYMSLEKLKSQIHSGIKYIWFIDEAIHPIKLKQVARFFINNNFHVFWQVRCRIEKELLDEELIYLLQKAGLKELRLGLESASPNILKSMNKVNDDFSLEMVEKICDAYSAVGISIHFPIIIGFPGESSFERKKTYDYLQYLCKKHSLVSFNINIFNLDISSYVFNHSSEYELGEIYYPCPLTDFLGNILQWKRNDNVSEKQLYKERDQYMRELLYPWMPVNAYIKPYLFYRFSETIRNTLIWKCLPISIISQTGKQLPDSQLKLLFPETLVYGFDSKRKVYIIYNWQTHHYMIGNNHLIFVLDLFKEACTIPDAICKLVTSNPAVYTADDLQTLLLKLYQQGYLIEDN